MWNLLLSKWQYAFYWRDWWKLWPSYATVYDCGFDCYLWVFRFGALQVRGYKL